MGWSRRWIEASAMAAPAAVIFDCDGVLLDSNTLKVALFREVVAAAGFAPADVARFSAFQAANFGMSRYRLFEALLGWEELVARPVVTQPELVAAYATLLRGRYVTCPATPAMREVVGGIAAERFVVSGSDEAELREVLAERGDAALFRTILGSPVTKERNIALVLADLDTRHPGLPRDQVVFVGDAEADWRGASAHGIRFVYMDGFSTAQGRMRALAAEHGFPRIEDLRGLPALLG
jgi:phosphoglycolate phosphatase-like HAD superfamily hydrolase